MSNRYGRPSRRGLTDAFLAMQVRRPGAAQGTNEAVMDIGGLPSKLPAKEGAKFKVYTGKKRKRR